MKLFVRVTFFFSLALAGLMLAGCETTQSPPAATEVNKQHRVEVPRFHVGETLTVIFSGTPTPLDSHEETVREDGNITLSLIGSIRAVGKTAGELQDEIHDRYVPQYFTRLTVTVKPGDLVYYVRGEVKGAGRQLYVGEITVSKAIASAGDFTDFANHNNVLIIRANGERLTVDCDAALHDSSKDPKIFPGDQIVISRRLF